MTDNSLSLGAVAPWRAAVNPSLPQARPLGTTFGPWTVEGGDSAVNELTFAERGLSHVTVTVTFGEQQTETRAAVVGRQATFSPPLLLPNGATVAFTLAGEVPSVRAATLSAELRSGPLLAAAGSVLPRVTLALTVPILSPLTGRLPVDRLALPPGLPGQVLGRTARGLEWVTVGSGPGEVTSARVTFTPGAPGKGVMYWPRTSPLPDFWRELKRGTVTWADIETDLRQLKAEAGVNLVRVFTAYDYEFREEVARRVAAGETAAQAQAAARVTHFGWTDGAGNHNPVYLEALQQFITLAGELGLNVLVTTLQELPALHATDDWSFLERDLPHTRSFISWLVSGIQAFPNLVGLNLINEPDGYGVWDDPALAGRVLRWLHVLKGDVVAAAPTLPVVVNTVTPDNVFKRFPTAPVGANTLYELTDILAQNTFLWADTGFWSGQCYRTQFAYMVEQNIDRKPLWMTECGFPANYAQQDVAGFPRRNEDGSEAGGLAEETTESIVPEGGIFDRPFGTVYGVAHTPESQRRAVEEAFYYAEKYGFSAGLVWSAYDHRNDDVPYVYRDPFGIFDRDGVARPAVTSLKAAFSRALDAEGRRHLSLVQGTVQGRPESRINGLGGYNITSREQNVLAGVYLGAARTEGGTVETTWRSEELAVLAPTQLRLTFQHEATVTEQADEPFIVRLEGYGRMLDYRFKRYGRDTWQRLDVGAVDVDLGWAPDGMTLAGAPTVFEVDFRTNAPEVSVNGTRLVFSDGQPFEGFRPWELGSLRLTVISRSSGPVRLERLDVLGEPLAPLPRNPRF
jgi:hypothetical protein